MSEHGGRTISRRLRRCILLPLRRLCDSYVRGMNGLSGSMQYGASSAAALGYPCFSATNSLQSFATARSFSSDEDLRDLIRAALVRSAAAAAATRGEAMRRSQSVAVGRIDEDAPCEFSGEVGVGKSLIFPRSRTCATSWKAASVAPS